MKVRELTPDERDEFGGLQLAYVTARKKREQAYKEEKDCETDVDVTRNALRKALRKKFDGSVELSDCGRFVIEL